MTQPLIAVTPRERGVRGMRVAANPQFELRFMGSFSVRHCGRPSAFAIISKKAPALLASLATQEPMYGRC